MRDTPNFDDANFALRLYELRREPELRKARNMVGELEGASWETICKVRDYDHPENAHFRQVTSFWEMAASFVNRGIFHPEVYLDTCGEALFMYATLEPHIQPIRESGAVRFLVQTERVIKDNPPIAERLASIRKVLADLRAKEAALQSAASSKARPAKRAKAKAR